MDTSGYYPQLGDDDPLFEIAQYTQLLKTQLQAESPPLAVVSFSAATWGTTRTTAQIESTKFKFLNESVVFTTDGNGYAAVIMPYTFANGYHVGAALNGDDWARPSTTFMVSTNLFTNTSNKFHVRALQGTSPVLNAVVRMNYIVTGW